MAAEDAPVDWSSHPSLGHSFSDGLGKNKTIVLLKSYFTCFLQVEVIFLWGTLLIPPDRLDLLWGS